MARTNYAEITKEKLLTYIDYYISRYGWAPTRQEMTDVMRYKSKNSAQQWVISLEKDGYLERGNGPRALRITGAGKNKVARLRK